MTDEIIDGGRDVVTFVDLQRTHDPEWQTIVNGVRYIVEKMYGEERENDLYVAWVDGMKQDAKPAATAPAFDFLAAELLSLGDPSLVMPERLAIKRWEHHGVRCAIVPAPTFHLNGYVQLPEIMRNDFDTGEEAGDEIGFTRINWLKDGWVGFDTVHGGDYWKIEDLRGWQSQDSIDMATRMREIHLEHPMGWAIEWSMERLTTYTESLAEAVGAYVLLDKQKGS